MRLALSVTFGVILAVTAASAQPSVRYSTYLGGRGQDGPGFVALGADGSTYTAFAEGPENSQDTKVRVVKFAPVTHAVVYSTAVDGSAADAPASIAVAPDGAVWVTGSTSSTDFPLLNPIQTDRGASVGTFLLRLSPSGTLTFSTYFAPGQPNGDGSRGKTVLADVDGSAIVGGSTCGGGLLATVGAFQTLYSGGCDGFISRISAAGGLMAATYLGGNEFDEVAALAMGPDGDLYVGGSTGSIDLPTSAEAFQATPGKRSCFLPVPRVQVSCRDGLVGRFSPDLKQRRYLTYLRESDPTTTATWTYDFVNAVAVGPDGDAYATGATQSGNLFPTTPGAYRTTCLYCSPDSLTVGRDFGDLFVTRLNGAGTGLVYSTFVGGSPTPTSSAPILFGGQVGTAIAIDAAGRAYVAGLTNTTDFPIVNGSAVGNGVLARFNAQGSVLEHSTRLGGSGGDSVVSLALADDSTVWLGGGTTSPDFPTTPDAWHPAYGGGVGDGFLTALRLSAPRMSFDLPAGGSITAPFEVGGWAIDREATVDAGIDAVHVYAYPNPGSAEAPIFLGAAPLGFARPDIAAAYGPQFANAGWLMSVDSLAGGSYLLVAYGHSQITGTFSVVSTRSIVLDSRPLLSLDSPTAGAVVPSGTRVFVGGWAIDQGASSGTGIDALHVWIISNGGAGTPSFAGVATYGVSRQDIGAVFGARFTPSGYELDVNGLAPGSYLVAVFAHSTVTNTFVAVQTRVVTIQ